MMRRCGALACLPVLFTLGCHSSSSPSSTQTSTLLAPLSAVQVQPLLANAPLLPTGTVTMALSLTINDDNEITAATGAFTGNFSNFPTGSSLTAATVNIGAAGVTGPLLINLNLTPGQVTFGADGTGSLSVTVGVTPSAATQILANPAGYYFQVATAAFPQGVLRGQFSNTVVTQH
jgi:CHRD domain-containing protein